MLVRVEYEEAFTSYKAMDSNIVEAILTTDDIPGSELSEPFSKQKADSLCWWLLCRGIQVPKSWNKSQIIAKLVGLVPVTCSSAATAIDSIGV